MKHDFGAALMNRIPAMTTPDYSSLNRVSARPMLSEDVYQALREALVTARIAPGSRMNLDALARELHVSNTPVRQALARLVADGLVTQTPYRGFTATPLLDSEQIRQLYEFRSMVEPNIAGLASTRRTTSQSDVLLELTDQSAIELAFADENAAVLGERDIAFHLAVASCIDNPVVTEHLSQVLALMQSYTLYTHRPSARLAWEEHRTIAEEILAGRPTEAATAMRAHLANGIGRIRAAIPH